MFPGSGAPAFHHHLWKCEFIGCSYLHWSSTSNSCTLCSCRASITDRWPLEWKNPCWLSTAIQDGLYPRKLAFWSLFQLEVVSRCFLLFLSWPFSGFMFAFSGLYLKLVDLIAFNTIQLFSKLSVTGLMFQSHQGKYSSSATYAADKQLFSHNALHRQRLAFRNLHGQSHEAHFPSGLGRCLFVEWLGRGKFWHQVHLFVSQTLFTIKLSTCKIWPTFRLYKLSMEMFFSTIDLWQSMMPVQLLKEACFSSFWGSFNFQPHIQRGWYCINIWDEKKMDGILPSKELEYCTQKWWSLLTFCQVTIPMSPEFTSVLQQCQAVRKKAWLHRGRIWMMGSIFTNVSRSLT